MKKILALQGRAYNMIDEIIDIIVKATENKAVVLFDKETIDDDIYEMPYAYHVDKYGYYSQGAIQIVNGRDVTIVLTGEEFGETLVLEITELPFESLVSILSYIEEE